VTQGERLYSIYRNIRFSVFGPTWLEMSDRDRTDWDNIAAEAAKPQSPGVVIQPGSTTNESRPIWELVIEDISARDQAGRAKYGTPLQAHNGRDAMIDAYQEALDLVVYLRQVIEERSAEQTTRLEENRKIALVERLAYALDSLIEARVAYHSGWDICGCGDCYLKRLSVEASAVFGVHK
jgi:hypothetical protein